MFRKFWHGFAIRLNWALRKNASFYGLVAKSEYDVVYGWYEEKRDECQRWEARVDVCESAIAEDLLTIDTLQKQLEEAQGLGKLYYENWNVQQGKTDKANDTIEKQAIEIDALQRMLQQYQLGKVKPKGVLK
jgi:hypothetical protein